MKRSIPAVSQKIDGYLIYPRGYDVNLLFEDLIHTLINEMIMDNLYKEKSRMWNDIAGDVDELLINMVSKDEQPSAENILIQYFFDSYYQIPDSNSRVVTLGTLYNDD